MGLLLSKISGARMFRLCALLICLLLITPSATALGATPVSVSFQIQQTLIEQGGTPAPDGVFTYTLTALDTGNPLPQGAGSDVHTFTIERTETKEIGPLVFSAAGTYTYEVRLHTTLRPTGHVYDEQIYKVIVHVRESNGVLEADTFIKKGGDESKVETMEFVHAYTPRATDPALMVDPPVKKTVSGNPPKDSVFTFMLTAKDPSSPMPEGSANGKKTLTILGSGEEDFGTWSYTRAGTYYYTVSEVNTGERGYTYDTSLYTITDVVRDEEGQLVLSRVVTNAANKSVSSYTYINTYQAESLKGPLTGDTTLYTPYIAGILIAGAVALGCVWYLVRGRRVWEA